MRTSINWSKLVTQGRVKAIGVPWSKEEERALKKGISPEDVRAGLLSVRDVKQAEKEEKIIGEKSLERMKKAELIARAKELEIEFDETAVTRADLILLIEKKMEIKVEKL